MTGPISVRSPCATRWTYTVIELDALLDALASTLAPSWVDLVSPYGDAVLSIALGRDSVSALTYTDHRGAEAWISRGWQTGLGEGELFAQHGLPTRLPPGSAVTQGVARNAAREFFATNQRPRCVEWQAQAGYAPLPPGMLNGLG